MTTEYSIQKMVSDGTLSTIALGIQYLQRNDIYIRIAGEETPKSGAPSGYTWSFLDNTTLKILPVVPNGVEVVVYRRTDVDTMYNIYSQNAQFDEATIDENNQQLLYIAQEYLEQGLPGTGVDTIEYVRDDGSFTYYRMRRTDGSYSEEFTVPSASNSTKVLTRESLRRSYAEAGFHVVSGSFQTGFTLSSGSDVAIDEVSGKAFSGSAGTYPAGTSTAGFVDESGEVGDVVIRSTTDLLSAILTTPATLNIKANLLITSSLALPRDITLKFSGAGKLTPASGVTITIDSYIDAGPSHIFNLSQGGLFIAGNSFRQFVRPEWFGAVGLVGVDDTVPLQTALDFCDSPALQKLRLVLSAKSYSFTNLLLEDQAYIVGKGLWNSLLKRLPGSTGVGITERTSATKISLVGFVLDCSGVSEVGLRLGFNGIQWGNEAIIDDFGIRDSGTARCAEINGNVGQIKTMLVQTTGTAGSLMYLDGGANKIDTLIVISTGVSPVGIEIKAGSTVIDKIHTEGKLINPCLLTGPDNLIKSMSFSAGSSHAVDDVVKLTGASSIRNIIDDVFVIKPASSTITNNVNDTTNGTTWEFNASWPHFRYAQGGQKGLVSQMGTVSLGGGTSVVVTFARTEPNTSYRVILTPLANMTAWVTHKTIGGFTLNVAAATASSCDYTIVR